MLFRSRQPRLCFPAERGVDWAATFTDLAAPDAHLRLLFSQPQTGPVTALCSLRRPSRGDRSAETRLLERVREVEGREMARQDPWPTPFVDRLGRLGWRIQTLEWEEALELSLGERLLERWFAPAAPYRASLQMAGLRAEEVDDLRRWFQAHLGVRLPQRVRHRVLEGRWPLDAVGTKKSPG